MEGHFSIEVDPARDLVMFKIEGFFSPADVARLAAAREQSYGLLRCPPGEHLTLCDATAMKIQTQEVVAEFSRMVADRRFVSRKLAFVIGSSLARLQAKRVPQDRGDAVQFFRSQADAESWLFA